MDEDTKYENLMMDIVDIKNLLVKIVELLRFMKAHHHIQMIPASQPYIYQGENLIPAVEDTGKFCNCGDHKTGELTGGWICPVHGQQF